MKLNAEPLKALITNDTINYQIKGGPTITTTNHTNLCMLMSCHSHPSPPP